MTGSRPRRIKRLWTRIERAILGPMMSVVAFVVERRLLKTVKEGGSSKKALEKAARDAEREEAAQARPPVGVGLGPSSNGGEPPAQAQ
jgi:hypothetical protein